MKNFMSYPKFLLTAFAVISFIFSSSAFSAAISYYYVGQYKPVSIISGQAFCAGVSGSFFAYGSYGGCTIGSTGFAITQGLITCLDTETIDLTTLACIPKPVEVCNISAGTIYNFSAAGLAPPTVCFQNCDFNIGSSVGISNPTEWHGYGTSTGVKCSVPSSLTSGTAIPPAPPVCASGTSASLDGNCYPPNPPCPTGLTDIGTVGYPNCTLLPPTPTPTPTPTPNPAPVPAPPPYIDPCIALNTCTPVTGLPPGGTPGTGTGPGGTAGNGNGLTIQELQNYFNSVDGAAGADKSAIDRANVLQRDAFNLDIQNSKVQADIDESYIQSIFRFSPVSNACERISKNIHGITVNIDFCTYTEMLRSVLAWLFGIFTAYTSFNVIFRAKTA